MMNIPDSAVALIKGEHVNEDTILLPGQTLQFMIESGEKGLGRLYTKEELAEFWGVSEDAVVNLLSGSSISPLVLDGKELYSELVIDKIFTGEEVSVIEPLAIAKTEEPVTGDRMKSLESKLEEILLTVNQNKLEKDLRIEKEWYTTAEVAELLKRKPNSIMQACNDGRIKARKDEYSKKWEVPDAEVQHLLSLGRIPSKKTTG
tara:strand:- start:13979 stop:14590 length:612 start_codon:yes stop_codon:yes gene_type:complete